MPAGRRRPQEADRNSVHHIYRASKLPPLKKVAPTAPPFLDLLIPAPNHEYGKSLYKIVVTVTVTVTVAVFRCVDGEHCYLGREGFERLVAAPCD